MYDQHLGHEFQSEVRTLTQVEHMNLVKFYGFLEHEDERILVVEYVANGTLREHLDCEFFPFKSLHPTIFSTFFWFHTWFSDAGLQGDVLDFASRLDIAIDVAHAVTYLHMYTGLHFCKVGKFLALCCFCVL